MMTEDSRKNMIFSGLGRETGGEYHEVRVSGVAKIDGDLRCDTLNVSGSFRAEGALICAGEGRMSGSVHVEGAASFGTLSASGACSFGSGCEVGAAIFSGACETEGALHCEKTLRISGSCKAEQDVSCAGGVVSGKLSARALHAETLEVPGVLKIEEDVEAERFESSGAVKISGLLNAEKITLSLGNRGNTGAAEMEIGSIGCGVLKVQRYAAKRGLFGRSYEPVVKVGTIEGDTLELENTVAEVVRGKNVRIGTGCKIERVEYSGTFERAENAEIEKILKI